MRIKDPQVAEFFLEHGVLATLRTWPYEKKLGKMITVNLGPFNKHGAKVVKVIVKPTRRDLLEHISISSFKTVEEWWKKALELHNGRKPTRLVVIIHRSKLESQDNYEKYQHFFTMNNKKHERCPYCGSKNIKEIKPNWGICLDCQGNFHMIPLVTNKNKNTKKFGGVNCG